LNLRLQHLIEAQLVLCSYCEAVHLDIDVLQELVSGMNLLVNFIIYPYLIPNDEDTNTSATIIPSTEILGPITRSQAQ
jgi:hypothetical protein